MFLDSLQRKNRHLEGLMVVMFVNRRQGHKKYVCFQDAYTATSNAQNHAYRVTVQIDSYVWI